MSSSQIRTVDLLTGDPANAIVIKYLQHKATDRSQGYFCAGDILLWAGKRGIEVPGKSKILWLNYRIKDAISLSRLDPSSPFDLEEVEGWGRGINVRWSVR